MIRKSCATNPALGERLESRKMLPWKEVFIDGDTRLRNFCPCYLASIPEDNDGD